MRTANKILLCRADALYRIDDKLAGRTTPGRCFRRDYKKAVRHARRTGKVALRSQAVPA